MLCYFFFNQISEPQRFVNFVCFNGTVVKEKHIFSQIFLMVHALQKLLVN